MTTKRLPSPEVMKRRREWCERMSNMSGYFHAGKTYVSVNLREHWAAKATRVKRERKLGCCIGLAFRARKLPLRVTLIRYSCRLCDDDGLPTAFKSYRDGIADAFGVDDSPHTAIEWVYKQQLCPRGCYGFRVLIEEIVNCPDCETKKV